MTATYQDVTQMIVDGVSAEEIEAVLADERTALTDEQIEALRSDLEERDLDAKVVALYDLASHEDCGAQPTMPTTLNDPAVAFALAYSDGRDDALEFRATHSEEECAEVAEDAVEPDEALISAVGTAWLARRWGIDWETQGRTACAEYNRGYRTALLED